MRLLDSRRLTGPNLLSKEPLALAEVGFDARDDQVRALQLWAREAERICALAGLAFDRPIVRRSRLGAAVAFHASIDVLLAATDVNDLAALSACDQLAGLPSSPLDPAVEVLREKIAAARSPKLLALQAAARAHGLPFLWDDELCSVGHGLRSICWPIATPMDPSEVPWAELGRVPVALISGTNGKTTSARLLARIALLAGRTPGLASTDAIAVAGRVLDTGDFTGPASARTVLRRPEVDFAVLETARGGILRRGLAVEEADGALLTNVAEDHLGEYGIDTVDDLAAAKAVICGVVTPAGRVVLNADDPRLLRLAATFAAPAVLFSLDASSAPIEAHVAAGGEAFCLRTAAASPTSAGRADLVRRSPAGEEVLLPAAAVAISFGGAARFNLANALGVAALASSLGLPRAAILEGLRTFRPDANDNPGRCNLVDAGGGVTLLIDFGHNPHGLHALAPFIAELRKARAPGRLLLLSGSAGDRSDDSLRALAAELAAQKPHAVYLRELQGYQRGRKDGEVPAFLAAELRKLGLAEPAVAILPTEGQALRRALSEARAGDFVALLVHLETAEVAAVLAERAASDRSPASDPSAPPATPAA